MNVLYQIPGDMSAGPLGPAELVRRRGLLEGWAAAGTHIEVADSPGGPLSIESHAESQLCVPPMMRALQRRTEPPDVIIVGCFGDPGLDALREAFDAPIVGPFDAAMHLGAQLGDRVGVVTILDSVVPLLDRLVRGMGMSSRYAGAVAIDMPVLELRRDPVAVGSRVVASGRTMLDRGADVIVLGCMSLAFLGIAEQTTGALEVPVINPARCALKTAEALAAQALTSSRRSYAKPRKPLRMVEETR